MPLPHDPHEAPAPHPGRARAGARDAALGRPLRRSALRPAGQPAAAKRSRRSPAFSVSRRTRPSPRPGSLGSLGVPAVILFGIPERKDETGSEAWDDAAAVQETVRRLKEQLPDLLVMTDVCLDEYTSHGHCGVIRDGEVDNDATLPLLAKAALSHARAGADVVAPSDMMDGRVGAIRAGLDANGFDGGRDPGLRRQVRVGVLRALPRGGRLGAGVR